VRGVAILPHRISVAAKDLFGEARALPALATFCTRNSRLAPGAPLTSKTTDSVLRVMRNVAWAKITTSGMMAPHGYHYRWGLTRYRRQLCTK